MVAKSANTSESGHNLVQGLADSLVPGILVVGGNEEVSGTPEIERLLNLKPGTCPVTLSVLPGELREAILPVLKGGQTRGRVEFTLAPSDRPPRRIQATVQSLTGASTDATVVVALLDVTGLVRLRQSLERLDRLAAAGTLAAGMAHEIKNALVAVKTFIELLLEKNKDAELASLVGREMDRINGIVRQLLKFGSASAPTHSPVRLHDVLEHSLRMVQPQLQGKLITLCRSFDAASDVVHGDNLQLEQVFVNLFLNAVDATGPNGTLTVRTESVAGCPQGVSESPGPVHSHVRVTVADTGAGIAPEHLAELFTPFFTTKNHGTGLGLPITRRIVEEHQGLITVESQPNRGTTFNILLPAKQFTEVAA